MTQDQALSILKTGVNVFLTGEPGSGKTHTINQYVGYLKSHGITPAITASTGIAATHINGMTIHSWSGIGILEYLDKYDLDRIASTERIIRRISNTSVLIIDEISMLSSSTLDMVDMVCRDVRRSDLPFGGLQIIFVGDFFQLPPINRNGQTNQFAYQSNAWMSAKPAVCYLSEQHRQNDSMFLGLLTAIRNNSFSADHEEYILSRKKTRSEVADLIPRLFTHNAEVDLVNTQMLGKLNTEPKTFLMSSKGAKAMIETLVKGCLSPEKLVLKVGAVVMFTKNHPNGRFVNGTLGTVSGFDKDTGFPIVKTQQGSSIESAPMEWRIEENGKSRAVIIQIPLRLAWAITVHKSQGMSMDAAAMDLTRVFEYGQGYVALSRVRTMAGLHLFGWNDRTFEVHPEVLAQDQKFREGSDRDEEVLDRTPSDDLRKIHERFILSSGGDLTANAGEDVVVSDPDADTYAQTLILWNEGKNIDEIGQLRKLKPSTILIHIEKLSKAGKISFDALDRILSEELRERLPQIHSAFIEFSPEKLSPVFAKFQGTFSYDDLRIARMLFRK